MRGTLKGRRGWATRGGLRGGKGRGKRASPKGKVEIANGVKKQGRVMSVPWLVSSKKKKGRGQKKRFRGRSRVGGRTAWLATRLRKAKGGNVEQNIWGNGERKGPNDETSGQKNLGETESKKGEWVWVWRGCGCVFWVLFGVGFRTELAGGRNETGLSE